MSTGRHPRLPTLDDTVDEQPRDDAATHRLPAWDDLRPSSRHRSGPIALTPAGEVADTDTEVDGWEQIRRFRAEVAEVRTEAAEVRTEAARAIAIAGDALTWNKRIVKGLVALTAVAGTALAFAFAVARNAGDAAGEKRERDAQRLRYIALIDQLVRDVARHEGQLGSLLDALRTRYPIGSVPIAGPPNQDPP